MSLKNPYCRFCKEKLIVPTWSHCNKEICITEYKKNRHKRATMQKHGE